MGYGNGDDQFVSLRSCLEDDSVRIEGATDYLYRSLSWLSEMLVDDKPLVPTRSLVLFPPIPSYLISFPNP